MNYFENHEYISSSFLKEYIKSPAKAIAKQQQPVNTAALNFGTCFHHAMEGVKDYFVFDELQRPEPEKNFGSKLNKQWKADIYDQHELVITSEENADLEAMVSSVKQTEFYKGLESVKFEGAEKEYYTELPNGKAKCKPDALFNGKDGSLICVDWKTTSEELTNNEGHIKRILNKYGYDIVAVHYTEILKQITGKEVNFFFMFVEKKAPYDALPVWINSNGEYYDYWFGIWNEAMQRCSKSIESGIYPTLSEITNNKYVEI